MATREAGPGEARCSCEHDLFPVLGLDVKNWEIYLSPNSLFLIGNRNMNCGE